MKYLGSKSRLAKDIIPIILKDQPTHRPYVEPFAGGMNTICEVPNTHLRIAADINPYLIAMWTAICDYNWVPPEYVDRDEYARVKQNPENYPDYYVGWVGFNCSYSGRFFQGFAGITDTKTGYQRNYQKEAQNAVQRQVKKLKGTQFICSDYLSLQLPEEPCIIYCDPPYLKTTGYRDGIDHEEFYAYVRNLSAQGHTVFFSEYQAPEDFTCVFEKQVKSTHAANATNSTVKVSTEKLFTC